MLIYVHSRMRKRNIVSALIKLRLSLPFSECPHIKIKLKEFGRKKKLIINCCPLPQFIVFMAVSTEDIEKFAEFMKVLWKNSVFFLLTLFVGLPS